MIESIFREVSCSCHLVDLAHLIILLCEHTQLNRLHYGTESSLAFYLLELPERQYAEPERLRAQAKGCCVTSSIWEELQRVSSSQNWRLDQVGERVLDREIYRVLVGPLVCANLQCVHKDWIYLITVLTRNALRRAKRNDKALVGLGLARHSTFLMNALR